MEKRYLEHALITFSVLLGGELVPTQRLQSQIANTSVVAADSGIRHALPLALNPVLWVGDFDSTDNETKIRYNKVPTILFPSDKDMTDGELAVNFALEKGAERLILCGAFGGERTDHSLLHITMAISLAEKNIPSFLTSGIEEGWPLIPGDYIFNFPEGSSFSIIAFSKIEGLSISGAKWSLHNASLDFGSSWTLSNQVYESLSITLHSGTGILFIKPLL
ncbi:MAG: thiamine pyrophosphokinase [Candidatus Tokpelaia sp. JSC188]|nr:MAG: thiamine pyrophosphokinase [Candidatus Tokpelaia sp. JSC188]